MSVKHADAGSNPVSSTFLREEVTSGHGLFPSIFKKYLTNYTFYGIIKMTGMRLLKLSYFSKRARVYLLLFFISFLLLQIILLLHTFYNQPQAIFVHLLRRVLNPLNLLVDYLLQLKPASLCHKNQY